MNNRPLVLDYIQKKSSNIETPFYYDYHNDISYFLFDGITIPFIDAPAPKRASAIQAVAPHESCCEGSSRMHLLIKDNSKTSQLKEPFWGLAELFSKTYADRERDDEDDFINYE